ncbi:hypothetical protein GH714_013322 [Hevea brasiliensis]|uniref:DNA repair protein REV1 n=1 Tax=Hevea brasiliensis TaxID=3981 RepID=A0A6A6L394_HEVBR|nr:hypothetical protein GH714_013322 [Hevea brasiliensis]
MVEKNRKLQNQFNEEASNSSHGGSSSEKPIFDGVSIFVDGFTIPSRQELRGYMLKYGGRFENYFSRHRVTHIICCNLPHGKIKNLRSFSGGLPVVKPAWILDSVVASKLLSWVPYQLEQLADNQPKLSAFFAVKNRPVAEDALNVMDPSLKVRSDCLDNQNVRKSPTPSIAGPSNPHHSTLEDPNFVDNYFKSSRLHFIGTWRNRYRKRFYPLSNEFRCRSASTVNASDNSQKTTIIHVDMDCFFVSVVIRNRPELQDKPVAVCHSNNPKGTAEISSANYPAREYGVKAGIFVRDAKAICPQLIIFPYNFQAYEEVADQFYNVLHKHCNKVQAVSCDEAFLDITDLGEIDPEDSLQKDFGLKTGEMLWNYSRGIDNRLVGVIQESKSVGAEVNWGVRFKDMQDSRNFLLNLCKEVSLRLQGCGVQGRTFTLKIKKRRKDALEPTKYMGCGDCENLSHSMTVPVATDDVEVLQRIANQLFGSFHIDVKDIRGVGLQVSKLENVDISKQGLERNSLRSWLTSASTATRGQDSINNIYNERTNIVPPSLYDLDMGVIESLPSELFSELNEIYGGKLVECIAQSKGKREDSSGSSCILYHEREQGTTGCGEGPLASNIFPLNMIMVEHTAKQHISEQSPSAPPVSGAGSNNEAFQTAGLVNIDLMPSSLSQVDTSVLQQLPEELRADILELLPAHRRREVISTSSFVPVTENAQEPLKIAENQSISVNSILNSDLWSGNPPQWVDKFKVSNRLILRTLAEMYYKLGSTGNLSSILQRAISDCLYILDESDDSWGDEASHYLCELLKQYIEIKIEFDVEEIYLCFRLLRRVLWLACTQSGEIRDAREMFDYMPESNAVSWSEMIIDHEASQ